MSEERMRFINKINAVQNRIMELGIISVNLSEEDENTIRELIQDLTDKAADLMEEFKSMETRVGDL